VKPLVLVRPVAVLLGLAALLSVQAGRAAAQEPDPGQRAPVEITQAPDPELGRGKASWYGPRFHGRRTSSGERFDMHDLTAAHHTLPFGTRVRVRNVANGREVVVRINDRGPRMRDRIIDLSKAAAGALGFVHAGEARVVLMGH
jgi:rare lipoprotein A